MPMTNALYRRRYALDLLVASLLGGLFSVGVDLDYFTPVGQIEPYTTLVVGAVGLFVCPLLYRLYEVVLTW